MKLPDATLVSAALVSAALLSAALLASSAPGAACWPDRPSSRLLLEALQIRPSTSGRPAEAPPSHMVQLYEGLSAGRRPAAAAGAGGEAALAARSIAPMRHEADRKNLLVFNMSCLLSTEDVFLAQLHLRRRHRARQPSARHRRRMRKTLDPPMYVRLVSVALHSPRRPTSIASYPVARGERGWKMLDVTAAVRESTVMHSTSSQTYLGVQFEEPTHAERRRARRYLTLPINEFLLSRHANERVAYLVLFSKENEDLEDVEEDTGDYLETPPSQREVIVDRTEDGTGNDNELKVMATVDFEQPRKMTVFSNYLDAEYDAHNNKITELNVGRVMPSQSKIKKELDPEDQAHSSKINQRKDTGLTMNNELPGYEVSDAVEGAGSIYHTKPTKVEMSTNAAKEANGTVQGEVFWGEAAPLLSSSPITPQGVWKEEKGRRSKGGMWEDAGRHVAAGTLASWEVFGAEATGEEAPGAGCKGGGLGDAKPKKGRRDDGRRAERSRTESSQGLGCVREVGSGGSGRGGRRNGKRRQSVGEWKGFGEKKGSSRLATADWQPKTQQPKAVVGGWGEVGPGNCSLRSYTVDFHALGWANWLYAPRLFQSALCTGLCPRLHTSVKDCHASSHARIQSLLSALRRRDRRKYQPVDCNSNASLCKNRRALLLLQSGVPCCVPNAFAPLILLYADENEDYVLRLFPSLKVISCTCT